MLIYSLHLMLKFYMSKYCKIGTYDDDMYLLQIHRCDENTYVSYSKHGVLYMFLVLQKVQGCIIWVLFVISVIGRCKIVFNLLWYDFFMSNIYSKNWYTKCVCL